MINPRAALLEAFNAAFNRHDVDGMMACLSENCVFENTEPPPDGTRYEGQAAVRAFWEDFFRQSPEAHIEFEDILLVNDRAVQRWVYSWRDAQGAAGHVRGVDILKFKDVKIVEKLSYVKG